jgi:hypothetical protein
MKQTFTILRSQEETRRVNGELIRNNVDKVYPGFGTVADTALGDLIEQLAEEECEDCQAAAEDGDLEDFEALRSIAIDQVDGEFEIYAGVHETRPDSPPIETSWSG